MNLSFKMPLLTCALAVGAVVAKQDAAAQTQPRATTFIDAAPGPRHPVRPPRATKIAPPDFRAMAAELPAPAPRATTANPDLIIVLDGGRRAKPGVAKEKDVKLQQAHDSIPDKLAHIAPNMHMLRIGDTRDGIQDLRTLENDVRRAVNGKNGQRPHGVLIVAMMNNAGLNAAGEPLLEINDRTNATAAATFDAMAKGLRYSDVDNVNVVLFPSKGELFIRPAIRALPEIPFVRVLAYTDEDHPNRLQGIPTGDLLPTCTAKELHLALTLAAGNLEFMNTTLAGKDADGGINNASPVTAMEDFAQNPQGIVDIGPQFIRETSNVLSSREQVEILTAAHRIARQPFADKTALAAEVNTSKPHIRLGCAVLGYIAQEAAHDAQTPEMRFRANAAALQPARAIPHQPRPVAPDTGRSF